MDLQPVRQMDYLQRTLSIFLTNPIDMSEQFESLIDELIKENKQINKSPKCSPESSSSDSKSDLQITSNSPQPLPKKRAAPATSNSKPPPPKRLKSTTNVDDDESSKKKKQFEDNIYTTEKDDDVKQNDDDDDDDDDSDEVKTKPSESQGNPSTSRDIDEFAIELGLVCNKCMVLTEEKDNRLVECHECHAKYHQKCHKPPVSTADISDPRCLWYCSKCRKLINKRQQSQSSVKETKTNSNSLSSTNKSKTTESTLAAGKKPISNSITDVTSGLFSFKSKSSDSTTSDTSTISCPSVSSSNSSLVNGAATKNTNGWASLATGFKEKKTTSSEVTSTTSNSSASSILAELTALTAPSNSSNIKHSPPSPKSLNPSVKQSINGGNTGPLKTTGSLSLSSLKSNKPSSPPVSKPAMSSSSSSSSLKSTQKLLPASKNIQKLSSLTPLGRQPTIKSPPSTSNTTLNRLNSTSSHSSGSSSSSATTATSTKIATGLDFEKRLKQMKKMAAEKSLTKKY